MEELVEIFKSKDGYCRMLELKEKKISTRSIAMAVKSGLLEKIKPGLYKLVDFNQDENSSFIDIQKSIKKAVVCLLSAASYYDLTTFEPPVNQIAVPNNYSRVKLIYPPVKIFYFSQKYYESGISKIKTSSGEFNIYCKEKTIADMFRYSNKIGEDIVIETLKNYLKDVKNRNLSSLFEFGKLCKVDEKMELIVKALL